MPAARKEFEKTSRSRDEVLATISHELRTPLTAILGWTQVLRDQVQKPSALLAKGLEVIDRNALGMAGLIKDILDMSHLTHGQLRLSTERLDMNVIAQAGLTAIEPSATAKGLVLEFRRCDRDCRFEGDGGRVRQIVGNLLSNAVKFTRSGGEIQVAVRRAGRDVVLEVRDTGQGIDPGFLPYVFDRFRQEDGSKSREHGGLGLGLAIVREIVEMHGGTVRAKSAGTDRGATFTVRLPTGAPIAPCQSAIMRALTPVGAKPNARCVSGLTLARVRVLVVDDDEDTKYLLEIALSERGASVRTASTAAEALEVILTSSIDVLVSDVGLPGHDGYWLMQRVRAAGRRLPAIAVTAHTGVEDSEDARAAGFDAHLCKPLDFAELVDTIAGLVRDAARSP